jgi:GNAT superfamily N-acetyltransferase
MILKATIEDVRPIIEMAQAFRECTQFILVDVETCVSTYSTAIKNGSGAIFFCRLEGEIVGAIACLKGPDLHYPRMLAIETFWYVKPDCGHMGVGKLLLNAFEQWAVDEKCDYTAMIHLADSYPDSLEALYARRGYKLAEKHYIKAVGSCL